MKQKKSIFDNYSLSVYKHAPEQTKVYYKGELCSLPRQILFDIGYAAITKGYDIAMNIVKRYGRMRRRQSWSRFYMYFKLSDGDIVYIKNYCGLVTFDPNNIQEKLCIYKAMLRDFKRMNYKIKTSSTATLGSGYVVESIKDEFATIDVSRVYFSVVDDTKNY